MLVSSFAFKKGPAIKDTSILNNKHFIFSFRARIIVWQLVMTELSVLAFPHIALSTVSNFMRFLFHLLLQDPLYKTRSVLIYKHFLFRIIVAITMSFMELPVLGLSHIVLNASQSLQDLCFIFCFGTRYKRQTHNQLYIFHLSFQGPYYRVVGDNYNCPVSFQGRIILAITISFKELSVLAFPHIDLSTSQIL